MLNTSKFNALTIFGGGIKRLPKGGQRRSVTHARLIDSVGGDSYGK